ncbi:putative dna-directed RNA polymerase I subunit [Schistosoma mansoni]|uniref:putative dna-directed RNA polymerase I subunit n=1 Tax=Schistosoma mansoni TaxID=6183 RepID=UPI0001A641B5|nr:putative dna-directed RNA polymerase I subunit [Schistosoma mansoni]|eukprot:XP_018649803.1 putative dna-directed RNA polymerase I subunit [Schistosoma mansoni]
MEKLSRVHTGSFDFFVKEGLSRLVKHLQPLEFNSGSDVVEFKIQFIEVAPPVDSDNRSTLLYPSECRRSGLTYGGELKLSVRVSVNGSPLGVLDVPCGVLPIMVMSRACNLSSLPRSQFYLHGEEFKEIGGYFIVHGKERVLRLLIMSRRNYPLAISRSTFKKRGHGYTEHAIVMRCVREDETVSILMLHWLVNGEPALAFIVEREQFLVPISIILRVSFKSLYKTFGNVRTCNISFLFLKFHIRNAMRILIRLKDDEYSSQTRALCYLGGLFRKRMNVPDRLSDEEAGKFLLSEYIAIHLSSFLDKYHLLCFMIKKLHAFVSGLCCEESNDNPMFQEVLLPSTLYLQVLRAKVLHLLANVKEQVLLKSRKQNVRISLSLFHQALLSRASEVSTAMVYMVSTGNLPPSCKSTLSAQLSGQSTGLSVPADNVNFLRFAAQFRAVHRGAFFTEMRTTSVRRLLPEAWGFFCPVHTPDGAPCGLLNHLAEPVEAVCETPKQSVLENIGNWLSTHKLRPIELSRQLFGVAEQQNALPVLLDGRLIGWLSTLDEAKRLALELRNSKVDPNCKNIPHTMEITLVPSTDVGSQYPGLYLFAGGSRLLRPVKNLQCPKNSAGKDVIEWIGTFEQVYLNISVKEEELSERSPIDRSHIEIAPENIFSFVAGLIPYPDFNQSPRNMYQCQMAKQTMGHSCYTWRNRSDAKAYRLFTPQSPLVRTKMYVKYDVDHYPLGFNAIVAVMSYTGYDMEDAMVINKASYDRGLAGACIYKSEVIDLSSLSKSTSSNNPFQKKRLVTSEYYFGEKPDKGLDLDGFPPVGARLEPGVSWLYAYTHSETLQTNFIKYEGGEQIAYVDSISLNGSWSCATITLRLPRQPDIGDKYSSRHGQKGINSLLIQCEEMPWSTTNGLIPDLIFNPHGFPTRMTMGMMIEFLAGKSAALTGNLIDATPFQWSEDSPPYEDYCQILTDCGFNHWGTETMMSGSTGRQLEAQIYVGVVYYQRLRHMVADKYQVRAEGRFDPILRQPIKGRKVGGGIRLGEMERDCLLSHGLVFSLQDRLVDSNCDKVKMLACSKCGGLTHSDLARNITNTSVNQITSNNSSSFVPGTNRWCCRLCDSDSSDCVSRDRDNSLKYVKVSASFRYLTYELACLNVKTRLSLIDLE